MLSKKYFVYIMTNQFNNVLYIGVTNNILKRIHEHKNKLAEGFTKKYNITQLVYYEVFEDVTEAILREKKLKKWKREWKDQLIKKDNPTWKDLYNEIISSI